MNAHRYAKLFPLMEDGPLKELAADIEKNGLKVKIITYGGEILEGRNREKACKIAGVKPEYEKFKGTDAQALDLVISLNFRRRHLTTAQRAEIGAKIATMTKGREQGAVTQKKAATTLGVSRSSLQRAKRKISPPKKKKDTSAGWTPEDLGKDEELMDAFTAVAAVYGNDDTKAIRLGTIGLKRGDVLTLAKLSREKMLEIQDLIMANHWTPEKAIKFLNDTPDDGSTIHDLQNWALGTNGKFFTCKVGGFTVTCKSDSAAPR
jgi:hypothetical protein